MYATTIYSPATQRVDPLLLVKEISHRVSNEYAQAIAGIRLAARGIASGDAQSALATAATRLLSFAEAHRALQAPAWQGDMNLADVLGRVCATMSVARLQERGISLTLSAASVPLAAERCWRIALIVAELITNSMRHGLRGGPGNIGVEVETGGPVTICRVVDDGSGKTPIKPGRGFDLVTGLAREIGGTVEWCFGKDCTSAELRIPAADREQVK